MLEILFRKNKFLLIKALALSFLLTPLSLAQDLKLKTNDISVKNNDNLLDDKIIQSEYIIGPGDNIQLEIYDLPELSGVFDVGPDGNVYLSEVGSVKLEGLTVNEASEKLYLEFSEYVKKPKLDLRVVTYRPVKVYVTGEVVRPGYYFLSGVKQAPRTDVGVIDETLTPGSVFISPEYQVSQKIRDEYKANNFPTVFDAIKISRGITPFSDLSKISLMRKASKSLGGGYIKTNLNFLPMMIEGNQSQNIRVLDGDIIKLSRSNNMIVEQMLMARNSNINPDFVDVFVSGEVEILGKVQVPNGSTLNQAIAMSGGKKIFSGKIEFIRFEKDGTAKRRVFEYDPNAKAGIYRNPVLMAGDIVNVKRSAIGYSTEAIGTITKPILGIYTLFNIVEDIAN